MTWPIVVANVNNFCNSIKILFLCFFSFFLSFFFSIVANKGHRQFSPAANAFVRFGQGPRLQRKPLAPSEAAKTLARPRARASLAPLVVREAALA